ncbi:shikimate kinase [Flexistipes sinusarabici]|uniref:Shikimate kinase n=1 Tax=Flexistipes sinusarabici TaxID=2352 RepID=A0A5D0MNB4_FLESI|nr:shikimate kinase [Flexistipes sinusarabici]TYB33425.1 MAG: shikimate kinase [Flexistipes sinusarabici]
MKNIYLLGFMGSGKTSVGKRLAEKKNMMFIDLDEKIEESEGMSIAEIFAEKGEEYFRDVEKKVLKELSAMDFCIVATGGGAVVDPENLQTMKDSGVTVSLLASPEIVYERVKNSNLRPLLNVENPIDEIKKLMFERAGFYIKSDIVVDTSDLSVDEAADEIIGELNE